MNNKDQILLHDYFDNLLSPEEQKDFEETLLDNIDLAIDLGKLKNLQRNLRNLPSNFEPSEIVIENIIDSLLDENKKTSPSEIESELVGKKKRKKKKIEKERKGLKAKTKFRLKQLLTIFITLFFIGVAWVGYYYFEKGNSTFPWRVSVLSENASPKLQNIASSGLNSDVHLVTSKNDFLRITIVNSGIIELSGESEITVTDGTHSLNRVLFERGKLNFTPQIGNVLFQLVHNGITIQSKNSNFEIETSNNATSVLRIHTNFIEIKLEDIISKIPYNHILQILDERSTTTPLIINASEKFAKLVHQFDIEQNDKTLLTILKLSTRYNAFTLHFMLQKVPPANRELILEKLQGYFPLPSSISKIDILMLDNTALNTWWDEIYRNM